MARQQLFTGTVERVDLELPGLCADEWVGDNVKRHSCRQDCREKTGYVLVVAAASKRVKGRIEHFRSIHKAVSVMAGQVSAEAEAIELLADKEESPRIVNQLSSHFATLRDAVVSNLRWLVLRSHGGCALVQAIGELVPQERESRFREESINLLTDILGYLHTRKVDVEELKFVIDHLLLLCDERRPNLDQGRGLVRHAKSTADALKCLGLEIEKHYEGMEQCIQRAVDELAIKTGGVATAKERAHQAFSVVDGMNIWYSRWGT